MPKALPQGRVSEVGYTSLAGIRVVAVALIAHPTAEAVACEVSGKQLLLPLRRGDSQAF
jgi:hypothetical protein